MAPPLTFVSSSASYAPAILATARRLPTTEEFDRVIGPTPVRAAPPATPALPPVAPAPSPQRSVTRQEPAREGPLFKKYVPLCKLVAEAGWEPETGVSVSSADLLVERFGDPAADGGVYYLTVFNPTSEPIEVEFTSFRDDLKGKMEILCGGKNLGAECVMVVKITK